MDRATQLALARRFRALQASGAVELAEAVYANPVADYTSPEQLAHERHSLFRARPILAGLSCDAPASGDFFTLDVAGLPILVVRGDDGAIRAFLNVCRHRGAPVAQGRGHVAKRFVCPFHAWSYDIGGRLASQSRPQAFDGVDREQLALTPLPVAEAFGLIYVHPTPGEPLDIGGVLSGAEREIAPFHLERYHHVETRSVTRAMNWKLVVDTFLEGYHVPHLHRNSIAELITDLAVVDVFGPNGRIAVARRSMKGLDDQPAADWSLLPHTTILYCLFPNAILTSQQDHFELWQVFPHGDSPDQAGMLISLYAPEAVTSEGAARHWKTNMDLLMNVTNSEDFALAEQIQRGFHSGAQEHVIFGRNEPLLAHYHRAIRASIDCA